MAYFFFKGEEDFTEVKRFIDLVEDYIKKTDGGKRSARDVFLISKGLLPAPALYKSPTVVSPVVKEVEQTTTEEEEDPPTPSPEKVDSDKIREGLPALVKFIGSLSETKYEGLYIPPAVLLNCMHVVPPCGECDMARDLNVPMCHTCAMFLRISCLSEEIFYEKDQQFRETLVEHPLFFHRAFNCTLFRYETRSSRLQIVVAYLILDALIESMANPTNCDMGFTKEWYEKAHKDRVVANKELLGFNKKHPLNFTVDDSFLVRFQKLEKRVYKKLQILCKSCSNKDILYLFSLPYEQYKDLHFDKNPRSDPQYSNLHVQSRYERAMKRITAEGTTTTPTSLFEKI